MFPAASAAGARAILPLQTPSLSSPPYQATRGQIRGQLTAGKRFATTLATARAAGVTGRVSEGRAVLVFVRSRLVLLATPKTGSTALHMALAGHADMVFRNLPAVKHIGLRRYQRFVAPLVAKYCDGPVETCALIREPEDWLGSWYRYRARPAIDGTARSTGAMDFERFVQDYLHVPPPPHAAVGAQGRFLTAGKGAVRVDRLFRHDRMEAFCTWLAGRLDTEVTLPRTNVSPARPMALSDATRDRLRRERARCFALYDAAEG